MKNRILFFLTLCATLFLTACNDNNDTHDYPERYSFATVKYANGSASDYYFLSDSGKSIYPSDKSRIGGFRADENTRVIVYFSLLETPVAGYDAAAAIYGIDTNIRIGATATAATAEEAAGFGTAGTSFCLDYIRMSPGYLNILLGFSAGESSEHLFTLVHNTTPGFIPNQTEAGYLNLELHHKAPGSITEQYHWQWLSFPYTDFAAALDGKKGILVSIDTRQNGTKYLVLDLPDTATPSAATATAY